jgi:glycosyltransferase involved in cell wall biosynthesis
MRILMLNANLAGCGTYHRALWFGRVCAQHGRHDVTLCTVSPSSRWSRATATETTGLRITMGPRWGYRWLPGYGSNWLDIAWRWQHLRAHDYDVIYAFEYHPNVAWPVYWGRTSSQTLLSDWCDWYAGAANVFRGNRRLHAWDRAREERIRLAADRVSVISSSLEQRALRIGVPPARVRLVREGVDSSAMRPHDRADSRRTLGIPDDALVVATLKDGHAFPYLVQACAALLPGLPRLRLLFVGAPGAAESALVTTHGLDHAFIATGWCTDAELPRHLSAADVCALPLANTVANQARFPHKIGDYLACGRAVLLTRVGDYPELLRAADAAAVCQDLTDFPDALAQLLRDREQRAYLAARGRDWVMNQLDWSVLASDILSFVEG